MNANNFPMDVWLLHRKLVHRFMKVSTHIKKATWTLRDYQDAVTAAADVGGGGAAAAVATAPTPSATPNNVVCLLSDSDPEDDGQWEADA